MEYNLRLKAAAEEGNIDKLYTLIEENPEFLDHMDKRSLVNTPLHVAAEAGRVEFAAEIMILKPSFAWKLNQQGFSPIHLALQHDHKKMVLLFVDINKDVVRVKGRGGLRPLHIASKNGDTEVLAKFLDACPDSIEDVTLKSETALHVATKYGQYEALRVLLGWIKKSCRKGARKVEEDIIGKKDDDGNNILHISAHLGDTKALDLVMKSCMRKLNLNAKNLENLTALDKASSDVIKKRLQSAGAKSGSSVRDDSTAANELSSNITLIGHLIIPIRREAYLVVAALVAANTLVLATIFFTASYIASTLLISPIHGQGLTLFVIIFYASFLLLVILMISSWRLRSRLRSNRYGFK